MSFHAQYTDEVGQVVSETFPVLPEGAYAALGVREWEGGPAKGALYIKRYGQGGTCLVPLKTPSGSQAFEEPERAGLSWLDGTWRNE